MMTTTLEVRRAPAPQADLLEVLRRSLALAGSADPHILSHAARHLLRPRALQEALLSSLGALLHQAVVVGALENRLLLLETVRRGWIFAHLGARPLQEIAWPEPIARGLFVERPEDPVSIGEVTPEALFRLTRPRVLLVALCHPEVFPLPRFPLGISDLARAIRLRFQGQVALADMQLGWTIPDLVRRVEADRPDVIGISATFGQYDLLECLADQVAEHASRALLVFGGSLCALNAARLLGRYPDALVAHGAGEVTMQDVVESWHGDRKLADVRGIHAKGPQNGLSPNVLPELDLLEETLDNRGVMQLESSRGCTHACSFCPRGHKGVWVGEDADEMDVILGAVGDLFAARPEMARKIFLVDEEFVGRDRQGEGLHRALQVARKLWSHGFRWETSSRVDQVYRPDRGRAWHVERMRFWTRLREQGMDRCLFGLESGVDSILERFNKKTTARQNALAIRLLSACGIPIRCTYITFDPLMSLSELAESYQFQGRKDLLLLPQFSMPFEALFEAIQDDEFAAENAQGAPLSTSISYMLVSMECLLGSPYLRKVEEAGLARDEMPAMGRRNAVFRDPLIGLMSDCAQRWIDRNFSFDYALKSLEKITAGQERAALRRARALLKDYSYRLLGKLLEQAAAPGQTPDFSGVMDLLFAELVAAVERLLEVISGSVVPPNRAILQRELRAWSTRTSWDLINE
ncbi:MAG TPA: radical SAM protein [Thermoanaerobaculia bacterium]|nr:radical SAM protein [Thermoanaerobaculia bacterium]